MFLYNEDCMCSDYKLVAIRAPHRTDETFLSFGIVSPHDK